MSVQTELNTLKQNLQTAKDAIATNLTSKGVTTEPTVTLTQMAENINSITGGGTGIDFGEIGYEEYNQKVKNDIAYAKEFQNNWNETQDYLGIYNDSNLYYLPYINTNNITEVMIDNNSNLELLPNNLNTSKATTIFIRNNPKLKKMPNWDYSKATMLRFSDSCFEEFPPTIDISSLESMSQIFQNCTDRTGNLIKFVQNLDTNKFTDFMDLFSNSKFEYASCITNSKFTFRNATNMGSTFENVKGMNDITFQDGETSKVTNFNNCFKNCSSVTIHNLDFSSVTSMAKMFEGSECYVDVIKNIGKSELTEYDFSGIMSLGCDGFDTMSSLYKYSFDRKTAGMPIATIILSRDVMERLMVSDIQQIEAKGYKIVETFDENSANEKINSIKTLI